MSYMSFLVKIVGSVLLVKTLCYFLGDDKCEENRYDQARNPPRKPYAPSRDPEPSSSSSSSPPSSRSDVSRPQKADEKGSALLLPKKTDECEGSVAKQRTTLPNPDGYEHVARQKTNESEKSVAKKSTMLPKYEIPKHLKQMIKKDMAPPVLKNRLSLSNYAEYFAALLYAEDYYYEKWSDFLLSEVTLELRSREAYENAQDNKKMFKSLQNTQDTKNKNKNKNKDKDKRLQRNEHDFIAFEIDSVPEKRPYLLSRDFVFVRPSGKMIEPFKGILFRVVKSTLILVEFEGDFHAQHFPTKKYDVSFSFNRVCLKRTHQAISAALDPSLNPILFPDQSSCPISTFWQGSIHDWILNRKVPEPYLIEGGRSTRRFDELSDHLTSTGLYIQELILRIYRSNPQCRVLVCAPTNRSCDAMMRSLQGEIPKQFLFRANAAFRDQDLVPNDIIRTCIFEGECFACPPLSELQGFKVISSTFMSSFRLCAAGIGAGHFTHVFMVDASSVVEPEAGVTLLNLVGRKTSLVVTGSCKESPQWVRSVIGRMHGLKVSYFQRLLERDLYRGGDPRFITHINSNSQEGY